MSLIYDEGQLAIASECRRALEATTKDEILLGLLDKQGEYDRSFWTLAREQGWTAVAIPEAYGGLGLSLVELGLIAYETGRTLAGAPFLTSSHGVASALVALADEDLKSTWLPLLASGDAIGTAAFGEVQDVLGLGVTLSGGVLSGVKNGVLGALHANVAAVLANEAGDPVLAIAPLADVEKRAFNSFDNSRCFADLHFDRTPATVIARGSAALDAARHILAEQSVVAAHEQTGGAERLMERARDYANTRRAFGQTIGSFQSVKHRIAEMYAHVELARAGAIHAATREAASDFIAAAAAARLQATESYDSCARDSMQIHGGIGVTWEAALHLHMRRARSLALEQGNLLFWEDILVERLTGEAA